MKERKVDTKCPGSITCIRLKISNLHRNIADKMPENQINKFSGYMNSIAIPTYMNLTEVPTLSVKLKSDIKLFCRSTSFSWLPQLEPTSKMPLSWLLLNELSHRPKKTVVGYKIHDHWTILGQSLRMSDTCNFGLQASIRIAR